MGRRWARSHPFAIIAFSVLVACGSTAQRSELAERTAAGGVENALDALSPTEAAAATAAVEGGNRPAVAGGPARAGSSSPGKPGGATSPPTKGFGFTATEISVGLGRSDTTPDYASQFGVEVARAPKEATMADGLARLGFFDPKAKIGVSSIDSAAWNRAIDVGLRPALARHRLALAEKCSVRDRQSEADTAGAAADHSACVLKFQDHGITHVLFLEAENSLAHELVFMRQAESQRYRPRYGLASMSGPLLLAQYVPEQLHGAAGIGWIPQLDVDASQRPKPNVQAERCIGILRRAGIADATDDNDLAGRLLLCEAFFVFEASVVASGGWLTGDRLVAGAEALGTSAPFTLGFGSRVAANQHDAVAAYRPFAFVDGCGCFRYVGPPTPTSS